MNGVGMEPQQRAEYVERWARHLESQGGTRISGRIYAHLATAEAPYLSLRQLAEELGVSKASVSTNTRDLIRMGMLKRVAVPGSRGEHYALDVEGTRGMLERAAVGARMAEALAAEGLALQPDAVTPGTQSLRVVQELYGQVAATFEQVSAKTTKPSRRAKA
jgi:DNA-binding MarR family transcriptional regulator